MMRDTLVVLISRSIDLGRPTPRWVGWASRVWPDLAEQDRQMRRIDGRLQAEAEAERVPNTLPFNRVDSHHDAWRGLLASGVGLAAAAAVAMGLFAWYGNDPAGPTVSPPALTHRDTTSDDLTSRRTTSGELTPGGMTSGGMTSGGTASGGESVPVALPLIGLLDRVQANTPASLRAGTQLQQWAGFLLLDLPATELDTLRPFGPATDPAPKAEPIDRVS